MIHVTIGNKQRPFKFGFNAIDIFCREHKIGISEFGERFAQIGKGAATIGELRDIIYAGLAGGALSTGEKIEFTSFQVGDWMDELPQGELAKMMEAITSSINVPGKKSGSASLDQRESEGQEALAWHNLWLNSSRAGISYSDFWKMTPCEWAFFMEGYKKREEDAWQRTRVMYALIYNTNVDRHHQMKPHELIPLPGDAERETAVEDAHTRYLTDEERGRLKRLYKLRN